MRPVNPLGDKVRAERLGRGESVRTSATRGGISNTWWARFEDGSQPLTPSIAKAVAKAFKWPKDWAEAVTPPVGDRDADLAELRSQVAELVEEMTRLRAQVALLGGATVPAPGRGHRTGTATPGGR